mmetsp:Transcript_1309/g.1189  ORF Transcript_1309/g.1189 Transcript_1309/m.1189 type:complete len:171 (+) Transcript_1309:185-697(+)
MGCFSSKPKKEEAESGEHKDTKPKEASSANKYKVDEDKPTSSGKGGFGVHAGDLVNIKKSKIKDEYSLKKTLGQGAYGEVKLATHKKSKALRAIKYIEKDAIAEAKTSELMAEVKILSELDHPNIMKVFEMYEDKKYYYVVSEYLEGGELFDRIVDTEGFSEKDAAFVMK